MLVFSAFKHETKEPRGIKIAGGMLNVQFAAQKFLFNGVFAVRVDGEMAGFLSNMTIGQLQDLVDANNLDPEATWRLITELRQLFLDFVSSIVKVL